MNPQEVTDWSSLWYLLASKVLHSLRNYQERKTGRKEKRKEGWGGKGGLERERGEVEKGRDRGRRKRSKEGET